MSNMKSYIDALRCGQGFDWICGYGHDLSKNELIDIIRELDYAIYAKFHSTGEDAGVYAYAADKRSYDCLHYAGAQ